MYESLPMNNPEKDPQIRIPEAELRFSFSRSGGAGGQNVNKVETKATIHWDFRNSKALDDAQKELVAQKLAGRINEVGEVVVYSQAERSQQANREKATQILNDLVSRAITVAPERKETRVPRREKAKRVEEKKRQSEKKESRRKIDY
jgi:ribosome-associated protein